jgi:release factor glutamine methyltransferase
MTISATLRWATDKFKKAKITSPALDAEVILSFTTKSPRQRRGKPRDFFYAHSEQQLPARQFTKYKKLVAKRAKHYPVAYITNNKEFFGLDFYVDKNVLIPRPETEILVEQTLKIIQDTVQTRHGAPLCITEIGTGSGCVIISLARNLQTNNPQTQFLATDISKDALRIARRNAKQLGVKSRVKFFHGNLLEPIKNKKIDVLVANLPYLDNKIKNLLKNAASKALKYEPQIALNGGGDGLKFYRRLFQQIAELTHRPRNILIEIGPTHPLAIKSFIKKILPKSKITVFKDLAGKNRVISVT